MCGIEVTSTNRRPTATTTMSPMIVVSNTHPAAAAIVAGRVHPCDAPRRGEDEEEEEYGKDERMGGGGEEGGGWWRRERKSCFADDAERRFGWIDGEGGGVVDEIEVVWDGRARQRRPLLWHMMRGVSTS